MFPDPNEIPSSHRPRASVLLRTADLLVAFATLESYALPGAVSRDPARGSQADDPGDLFPQRPAVRRPRRSPGRGTTSPDAMSRPATAVRRPRRPGGAVAADVTCASSGRHRPDAPFAPSR